LVLCVIVVIVSLVTSAVDYL